VIAPDLVAIVILVLVMIMFITEVVPLPVAAMLGALAMAACGIISFPEAFAGFANDTLMMVVGMLVIGLALYESGLLDRVGSLLGRLLANRRRAPVGLIGSTVAVLSACMSNTAVAAAFLPLVDSLAARPQGGAPAARGAVSSRPLYMVVGVFAVLGGNLTLIGSTPQLVVQGVLDSSGLPTFGFFSLLKGALPLLVVGVLYFSTVGRRLLAGAGETGGRTAVLAEVPAPAPVGPPAPAAAVASSASSAPAPAPAPAPAGIPVGAPAEERRLPSYRRMCLAATVFVLCIVGIVAGLWTVGAVAMLCALLLVALRCIDLGTVVRKVDWSSVVILGGSLGFSAGLEASGVGRTLASGIIGLCGGSNAQPLLVFSAVVVVTAVLSCLISNTAVAAMMAPMGIFLAQGMGFCVTTMVVGIVLASSVCFATPIGTPPMTLTLSAGYRFTEYLKVGTPFCLLLVVVIIVFTPLLYGW
jgi:di/tricarboxylate transporter